MIKYFIGPRISFLEFVCILIAVEFFNVQMYLAALVSLFCAAIPRAIWDMKQDRLKAKKNEQ